MIKLVQSQLNESLTSCNNCKQACNRTYKWNKIQEIDQLTKGKTKLTLQYPHKVSKAEIVMDTYLKFYK